MAKGAYLGVGSKARKIKKMYVGIGGKARKVKKAYIGIGGKARLWYSFGTKIEYYGTATDLGSSHDAGDYGMASIGGYGLFAGGFYRVNDSHKTLTTTTLVEAYDGTLTKSTPTALNTARAHMFSANVGNYVIFAGGVVMASSTSRTASKIVEAYNASLTRTILSNLSSLRNDAAGNGKPGATSTSSYAFFAGGYDGTSQLQTVDIYNNSLTKSTASSLALARERIGATSINNNAIFVGGYGNSYYRNQVDFYNNSLTHTSASYAYKVSDVAGASINNYAIFVGGYNYDGDDPIYYSIVYTYDTSLTVEQLTPYPFGCDRTNGVSANGIFAIFAGGYVERSSNKNRIFYYDNNLTRTELSKPSIGNSVGRIRGVMAGDYYLIADQDTGASTEMPTVDVYQIS